MVPIVAIPNLQSPTPIESSVFAGQISDPQVGRLPFKTVSAPIEDEKVTDQQRNRQQSSDNSSDSESSVGSDDLGFSLRSADGELFFDSPFSTPFIAQLFAQIPAEDNVIGTLFGEGTGVPSGFVDFDRLAEFGKVKYKPSHAFEPHVKPELERAIEAFATREDAVRQAVENAVQDVSDRLESRRSVAAPVESQNQASANLAQTSPSAQNGDVSLQNQRELSDVKPPQGEGNEFTPPITSSNDGVPTPRSFDDSYSGFSNPGIDAYTATQSRVGDTASVSTDRRGGGVESVSLLL